MTEYQWVLQAGAVGVFLLVFGALIRGNLRTKQEVDTWRDRALRAEVLVDKMLPAVSDQTVALNRLTETVQRIFERRSSSDRSP